MLLLTDGTLDFCLDILDSPHLFLSCRMTAEMMYALKLRLHTVQMGVPMLPSRWIPRIFPGALRALDSIMQRMSLKQCLTRFGFSVLILSRCYKACRIYGVKEFYESRGGLFATGDHKDLGQPLGENRTWARSMCRCTDTLTGEVSMAVQKEMTPTEEEMMATGSLTTNQTIQPKSGRVGRFWRETYPHPLVYSPAGRITILPGHPIFEDSMMKGVELSKKSFENNLGKYMKFR